MISFIALGLYLTVLIIVMYNSVIEVDNHPLALLQAIIMVVIVAGIPAMLGVLNGMNIEKKKHGRQESNKSNEV